MITLYGGTYEQVWKQFDCPHDWHGPCIDDVSRYLKCRWCFALQRDFANVEAYYAALRGRRAETEPGEPT